MTAQAGDANISAHTRPMVAPQRSRLRSRMRAARRALTSPYRHRAADALAVHVARLPQFRRANRIAGYLAQDGEIDPMPLLRRAVRQGRQVSLPVIDRPHRGAMQFLGYLPGDPLRANRYGIPEPVRRTRPVIDASELDLVLVPLVAFDMSGNRLGMGGGYYDRRFAVRRERQWRRPVLIGIAYEMQRVPCIECEAWDVPLDAVVTESGVHK